MQAMARLLNRARSHPHDPNLFAGLVHACRYCGLLAASVAANRRAKNLDAHVRTTVPYTLLHLNEFQKALDACRGPGDGFCKATALFALRRTQEAIELQHAVEMATDSSSQVHVWVASHRVFVEGDVAQARALLNRALGLPGPLGHDPESAFWIGRQFADMNDTDQALAFLSLALDQRYCCLYPLMHYARPRARFFAHPSTIHRADHTGGSAQRRSQRRLPRARR
jgi:tetratricopeptide (TPR) repeat protein